MRARLLVDRENDGHYRDGRNGQEHRHGRHGSEHLPNGRSDGRLSDLKPDDRLVFTYDEINGVNVVDRIAPTVEPANTVATTQPQTGN